MIHGLLIALLAATGSAGASYGDNLLDAMHRRHPQISSAEINVTDDQGRSFASSRRWSGRSLANEKLEISDANGKRIGTIVLTSRCSRIADADDIVRELSQRIYAPGSLAEPDPFVVGATRAVGAQAMIDDALGRDPDIVTLAFHVTPPGSKVNIIAASSFGRIGKPADADDERVIEQQKTIRETTNGGKRLAVELPLLDVHGSVIGALSTSFKMTSGGDPQKIEVRAVALRDALARRTSSLKALFRPVTVSRQVRSLPSCHS